MNKKLLGIAFITTALLLTFPTKADTTGTVNTGTVNTGISITGNCYPVISGLVISVVCTTGTVNTGTVNTGTINTGTSTGTIIIPPTPIYTGTEFQQALAWMYANGLTKYSNEKDYRADDGLTREEAAKIIGQAFITLGYSQDTKNSSCGFTDANQIDPTLSGFVINTCKRGIFKGTTDNKFLPIQKLSRPQAIALLVRIFEGKVSNESRLPRWGDYYIKGQALGLTTLNNQTTFDTDITRREIAIYIYRFRNIVSNETLKLMMLNKLNELGTTGQNSNTGMLDNFGSLADSLSVNNDPELLEAIRWMNDNGLTSYKNIPEYKPFEILNREQAAKILTMFANVFNFVQTGTIGDMCTFKDVSQSDVLLVTYIENVCKLGIMQGSDGYFNPKGTITKSQFIAAIIRLFDGKKLDETTSPRWKNYFERAQELGMIGPADAVTFDNVITRYEVALFLYRFKIKNQILQNMNNNSIQNQIISTVPGSITTGTNNMPQSNVYVDMNLLQNGNFDVGYLELFGQRYKVVKSNTSNKVGTNNFVRYGNIFTLDTEVNTGTTSFIVSSLSLIEGTIRIGNSSTFSITPIANTNAYYKISKTK
ncbi:MAG: S-layer homology domain-containing protein [candidate division SR1 bacterium]|nr:S-layer homology domain-containing protein [candidate division SR1 bacterium]